MRIIQWRKTQEMLIRLLGKIHKTRIHNTKLKQSSMEVIILATVGQASRKDGTLRSAVSLLTGIRKQSSTFNTIMRAANNAKSGGRWTRILGPKQATTKNTCLQARYTPRGHPCYRRLCYWFEPGQTFVHGPTLGFHPRVLTEVRHRSDSAFRRQHHAAHVVAILGKDMQSAATS